MKKITIYHNPKCSKSRAALQMLQEREVELEVIEYLKNPPAKSKLTKILKYLGLKPRELMRVHEEVYKELELDNPNLTEKQLIEIMTTHPILIERPIVVSDEQAIIGRPPESVLTLLD